MKNALKLLRRMVLGLLGVMVLLPVVNILILMFTLWDVHGNGGPYSLAQETADALTKDGSGYHLRTDVQERLKEEGDWAVLLDPSGTVVWQTENLPAEVPKTYSLTAVAQLTRGYIVDYPTFPAEDENGLLVLGCAKDSYWKHLYPAWDYQLISKAVPYAGIAILINVGVIILIYVITDMKILRSVGPIMDGIQNLSMGKEVCLQKKGLLADIAGSVNRTSEILREKECGLKKKETARANWIAGVSHDIRTPLSMVLGYAGQLTDSENLSEEEHRKAEVICRQGQRIKNLINDLNLASKLEYDMQPLHMERVNAVALIRQIVVDYMNTEPEDAYPICWMTKEDIGVCVIQADPGLLKRAVGNLIQNSVNHNPSGCTIYVTVEHMEDVCQIRVEDDGVGISREELKRLNETPHYMLCDENVTGQRHGLGLLIVRQIVDAHGGEVEVGQSGYGGFLAKIRIKIQKEEAGNAPS